MAVDITYSVQIVSSITSSILHMEDGLTLTECTYSLPAVSGCVVFTVVPVNEAGAGIADSIQLSQAVTYKISAMGKVSIAHEGGAQKYWLQMKRGM